MTYCSNLAYRSLSCDKVVEARSDSELIGIYYLLVPCRLVYVPFPWLKFSWVKTTCTSRPSTNDKSTARMLKSYNMLSFAQLATRTRTVSAHMSAGGRLAPKLVHIRHFAGSTLQVNAERLNATLHETCEFGAAMRYGP